MGNNHFVVQLLATVLPLAVAAAISPSITAITLALLGQDERGRNRAIAFWFGAVISMLVWVIIVSSFMWQLLQNATHAVAQYSQYIDLGLGALLIGFGTFRLLRKPRPPSSRRGNIRSLGEGPLSRQVAFGAIMQGRNTTSVIMFCAAQQHIDAAPVPLWFKVVVTLIVLVITTSSIWLVILVPGYLTHRFDEWSEPAKRWLSAHARTVELVVAFGAGAYLIGRAALALTH